VVASSHEHPGDHLGHFGILPGCAARPTHGGPSAGDAFGGSPIPTVSLPGPCGLAVGSSLLHREGCHGSVLAACCELALSSQPFHHRPIYIQKLFGVQNHTSAVLCDTVPAALGVE
jgi:hypothetical protein